MSPNASRNAVPIIDVEYPTGAEAPANAGMAMSAKTQCALKPAPSVAKAAALNVDPFAVRCAESANPMNVVKMDAASALLSAAPVVVDKAMAAEGSVSATTVPTER